MGEEPPNWSFPKVFVSRRKPFGVICLNCFNSSDWPTSGWRFIDTSGLVLCIIGNLLDECLKRGVATDEFYLGWIHPCELEKEVDPRPQHFVEKNHEDS